MFGRSLIRVTKLLKPSSSSSSSFLPSSALLLSTSTPTTTTTTTTSSNVRLYHKRVVEHFENPRNVGSLDAKDPDVGTGLVGAPACGDVMKLQFRVNEEGVIQEAKFKTFGCGSAIASSSYATTWLEGKTLEEASRIKNKDISDHLNLPPVKIHCSMLAEDAIKAAINDLGNKQNKKKQQQEN